MLALELLYRWQRPWPSDLPVSTSWVTVLHHHLSLYMMLGTKSRTWSMLVKHPTDWTTFSVWFPCCARVGMPSVFKITLQEQKAWKIPHTRLWNVIYLNIPTINSETPIRCPCHIKESNQSLSSLCHLTKMKPRFEFSASLSPFFHCPYCVLLYESESLSAWMEAVLCICPHVYVCFCVSVMFVPNKGLCSIFYWTAQNAPCQEDSEWGIF